MSDRSPLLRLRLPDGRPATLLLSPRSTVVSIDEVKVSSYDLCGRPYALVRNGGTFRRALDGRVLEKGVRDETRLRVRRLLAPEEAAGVVEAARLEAEAVVRGEPNLVRRLRAEAVRRLRRVVATGAVALREDAARFAATYRAVGILPPDQYLSLVIEVTEGCSWNTCTFCDLYRGVPFRVKTPAELEAHMAAVRTYFGRSLSLRRSLFIGTANALSVGHDRLLPLLEAAAREFRALATGPRAGIYSFVDSWTGHRKGVAEFREYARLGLRRVYVGLESGDPDLLAWLDKPGSPDDVVDLVATLHEAGIAAGVIVLVGAGGERFSPSHARLTAQVLSRMRLGAGDLLYFSELVSHPGLEYGRRAASDGVRPLGQRACEEQRRSIVSWLRPARLAEPLRIATYDIREFVY